MTSLRGLAAILAMAGGFLLTHPATGQTVDINKIWDRYRTALVQLEVTGTDATGADVKATRGTGIIVRSNGKILTALHVVGPAAAWQHNPDGTVERRVSVTRLDGSGSKQSLGLAFVTEIPEYDIAVLDINATGLSDIELNLSPPPIGGHVAALPWDPNLSIGKPIDAQLTTTDRAKYGDRLTLVASIIEGNSGAPVFSADEKLVGIITNKIDAAHALAVPAYLIYKWVPPIIAVCDDFTSGVDVTSPVHTTPTVTVNVLYLDAKTGCRIRQVDPTIVKKSNFSELKISLEDQQKKARITFNLADRPQPGFAKIDFLVHQEPLSP